MIVRLSNLYNGNPYVGKIASLYLDGPQLQIPFTLADMIIKRISLNESILISLDFHYMFLNVVLIS